MRLPITFSAYIARNVLMAFLTVLIIIVVVMALAEWVELLRRTSEKEAVTASILLQMVALKLPEGMQKVLPFCVLIAGMVAFVRLSKSSELIVARASGISVWQFLAPAVVVALIIGVLSTAVVNPVAAAMIARFEMLEGKYIEGKPSTLTVSASGLWLRHIEVLQEPFFNSSIEEYILHAQRIDQSDLRMHQVAIFMYGAQHRFIGRIDAVSAQLELGQWRIRNATASAPAALPVAYPDMTLQTDLSLNQIKESFASPQTLSFWQLPSFIDTLQKAGFSAIRHQLHWLMLWATPLMLVAMLLLGALFSLRHHRRGKISMMITFGVFCGFIIYFSSNIVYALGYSGSLPTVLAAFLPPIIIMMVATSALLHLEDG